MYHVYLCLLHIISLHVQYVVNLFYYFIIIINVSTK